MTQIKIADGQNLPIEVVTQRIAIMGMSGSGKSNTAAVIIEQLLALKAQTVILDNDGSWYGLRLGADGRSRAFDIPVFGGLHADVPLDSRSGKFIADLIVDKGISCILDVSMMRKNERHAFATDLAEQLFYRKKEKRSPMMFAIEEAQDFIPQKVFKGQERMVGAFEDLGKAARKYGVGTMILSQRPQAVNKDALNQAEMLIVHQMMGSQERKALQEWVVDKGLKKSLLDELAGLGIGDAYIWSPRWLKTTKQIHVYKKTTYDAAATPKFGSKIVEAPKLSPMDLAEIEKAMEQVIQQAKENDPKQLKAEIQRLRNELTKQSKAVLATALVPEKIVEVKVPVISPETLKALEKANTAFISCSRDLHEITADIANSVMTARKVAETRYIPSGRPALQTPVLPKSTRRNAPSGVDPVELAQGEEKVLICCAQYSEGCSKDQLTILTGYKRSTRDTYIRRLAQAGLVEDSRGLVKITAQGQQALPANFEPLPIGEDLKQYWYNRLPEGEAKLLRAICEAYPQSVHRESLDETLGFARSTRDTYIRKLEARKLVISVGPSLVEASPMLFG